MKKRKTVNGFTLVELIVVIAIIGVLASILVPSMLGYVNQAKFAALNSNAKALFNATMTACRESDVTKPIPWNAYTSAKYAGGELKKDDILNKYIYEYFPAAETVRWAVRIEGDVPVGACVQKRENDGYIGTYPIANKEKQANEELIYAVNYAETGKWSSVR